MSLHKVLLKQLARLELSEKELPGDLQKWQAFINRLNNTYLDADQERYLLERSMEISSKELKELNAKLETAQHIARLGYWYGDWNKKEIILSRELKFMFGVANSQPTMSLDAVLDLVHEEDRARLDEVTTMTLRQGVDFEIEVRMKKLDDEEKYYWFLIVGHSINNSIKSSHQLTGIVMDISKKKESEEKLLNLQQQLLTIARRAGMADVATAILHNVGNILNSANVSVSVLQEYLNQDYLKKMNIMQEMMAKHSSDLISYLSNDPKGKLVPEYLAQITNKMANQLSEMNIEVDNLKQYLSHIKDITAMQKSLSGVTGVKEQISISEIVDHSIKMCGNGIKDNGIKIVSQLSQDMMIVTDRNKLLQILINLITNAKDSLVEIQSDQNKIIKISCEKTPDKQGLLIKIADNGIGIPNENLTRIFSYGFTTKLSGHGFGLHSSALTAIELGGKLEACSKGTNQGAEFILTLPLVMKSRRTENENIQ